MPEYLSPGVYVEEVATGPRPIEGVGTSTAGFVGRTERGPVQARLVASWSEYVRWFGGYLDPTVSFFPFAVKGFFDNGGQRAFIARVVGAGSRATAIPLQTAGGPIAVTAVGQGAWGNHLLIRVRPPQSQQAANLGQFRLTVLYYADGIPGPFVDPTDVANFGDPRLEQPDVIEDYETLSMKPEDANFYITTINTRSTLIRVPDDAPTGVLNRPVNVDFPRNTFFNFPTADANTLFGVQALRAGDDVNISIEIAAGGAAGTARVTASEDLGDMAVGALVDGINATSSLVTAAFAAVGAGPIVPSLPTVGNDLALPDLPTADANTVLRLTPRVAGATLTIDVTAGAAAGTANIRVNEIHDNLTAATILNAINSISRLVRVEWVRANPPAPFTASLPAFGGPTALAGGAGRVATNGADGTIGEAEHIGNPGPPLTARSGLAALRDVDEVAILCAPDEVRFATGQLTNALVDQCEQLKDRFAVLSIADRRGDVGAVRPPRDSSYAAVYYPFIRIMDPRTQTDVLMPPAGHVVGIYARTDVDRGVHKAPANTVVRGMMTRDLAGDRKPLEFTLAKGEHDILNPRGVNVIRDFRPYRRDLRVWGARTMSSDGQWRYVNVRRLFIFVEESIEKGTQWVVFEPNDETTWSAVRRSISGFLTTVWRNGALMGATTEEAFFVKCDRTTMTQDDIDNGRLICLIGIAPVKPAEFVIFRISQKTFEAQA